MFKLEWVNKQKGSQAYRARWAKDYRIVAWGSDEARFAEYLEMGEKMSDVALLI